ncbi:sigma-70 family RNA polymerase sigma factor [Micromonospora sp. NPDC050795]|uniref:sigma-70 family RNA polymerase sigma factor n=1 Tax=Micromonospora sp. NPDC050795 TaxID=3364282 RepID=UPI0037BA444B
MFGQFEQPVAQRPDPHREQAARAEDSLRTGTAPAAARLEQLHRACSKPLFRYLVKLTLGDRRLAEDIMQETFVRAWSHLSRHDDVDVTTFRPWLYTVSRRLVVDTLRARKSRPVEVVVDDLTQLTVASDNASSMAERLTIRKALMLLQPEQRSLLLNLYYHGQTIQELADELNIPVGTVKSRVHYAKGILRAHLDQQDHY